MIYVIDAHAWIEYVLGTAKGRILGGLFEGSNRFITLESTLAELNGFSIRMHKDFQELYEMVREKSTVMPILFEDWIAASIIRATLRQSIQHFGIIDSLLIVKQQQLKAKIITGDPHFKTMKNVIFLK